MMMKVIPAGDAVKVANECYNFKCETGKIPIIHTTKRTYVSYVNTFTSLQYYDDETEIILDGIKYMFVSSFLYGENEVILSDGVLVLVA